MKLSDVMSAMGLSVYAETALLIFVGVFVGVVLDLYFSGRRSEAMSLLPLEEDANRPRPRGSQP
jgi:hypothetical protein